MKKNSSHFDIIVIGSGFSGSLTALLLNQSGFKVCVVEKSRHPRFSVGESSTPIADMILRDFADEFNLPWLADFSRYGTWQQSHPDIPCGIKRGFSYFQQTPGKPFWTTDDHANELLVAASVSDENSDTQWFRAYFDHYLARQLGKYDIAFFEETEIKRVRKNVSWSVEVEQKSKKRSLYCSFIIDASGSSAVSRHLFGVEEGNFPFLTRTSAIYSHFRGVTPWLKKLGDLQISDTDYPYDPDHSALHLLLEKGWLWLLRFNNNLVSSGLVIDLNKRGLDFAQSPETHWRNLLSPYPSITSLFKGATVAKVPGRLIASGRLQRMLKRGYGEGWAALPNTIGFIDPLHSTGIAHALTGIEKLVKILKRHDPSDFPPMQEELGKYEKSVKNELQFIDKLVAGCYRALPHFELFNGWSMLYFTAAIAYEQARLQGEKPCQYLCANRENLQKMVDTAFQELEQILTKRMPPSSAQSNNFCKTIRRKIAPYNIVGLLDPDAQNMYHHTAVTL